MSPCVFKSPRAGKILDSKPLGTLVLILNAARKDTQIFCLTHPEHLGDILKYHLAVFGPTQSLIVSVPYDSVAYEWLLSYWAKTHADTGESLHLYVLGTTYEPAERYLNVPIGITGQGFALGFDEGKRIEGVKWLRSKDDRLSGMQLNEAYALLLNSRVQDDTWSLDPRPLHAISQLTADGGGQWRSAGLRNLDSLIAPIVRNIGQEGGPDLGKEIRSEEERIHSSDTTKYLKAALRVLRALTGEPPTLP